jgi:hypothetical protein
MMKQPPLEPTPPGAPSRITALVFGGFYVYFVAAILSQATRAPLVVSLFFVSLGSAVIMAVMVVFGVKAYKQDGRVRQFQLSSLFLLIIPIAIYSTAIRTVFETAPPTAAATLGPLGWTIAIVFSVLFVVLSTVILLWLADALMWLAVLVVRTARYLRQPDSET